MSNLPAAIAEPTPDIDPAFERVPARDEYGGAFGDVFQSIAGDACLVAFQVRTGHLNMGGICHGGAMMTFADIALSRAARTVLRADQNVLVTANLNLDFIAPARPNEWVVATARPLRRTRHLVFTQATMAVASRVVASGSAIFAILGQS